MSWPKSVVTVQVAAFPIGHGPIQIVKRNHQDFFETFAAKVDQSNSPAYIGVL